MVQTTHISGLNGMGTFAYAAPELLTGGKCNEVADIFSFGVLLWELVTGEIPRRGKLRELRCAPRLIRRSCSPRAGTAGHNALSPVRCSCACIGSLCTWQR